MSKESDGGKGVKFGDAGSMNLKRPETQFSGFSDNTANTRDSMRLNKKRQKSRKKKKKRFGNLIKSKGGQGEANGERKIESK